MEINLISIGYMHLRLPYEGRSDILDGCFSRSVAAVLPSLWLSCRIGIILHCSHGLFFSAQVKVMSPPHYLHRRGFLTAQETSEKKKKHDLASLD